MSFTWTYKTYAISYWIIYDFTKISKTGVTRYNETNPIYNLIISNFYKTIYITDIVWYATGFNKNRQYITYKLSITNKKNNSKTISLFKDIALEFYNHVIMSAGVYEKSKYITDLMVIKNSDIKESVGL